MRGGPARRRGRLGPDAAVEPDGLAEGRQPGGGQQRPGLQVAGRETRQGRAGAAWLLRPLPGGVWLGFLAGKAVADVAWYGLEAYARRGVAWSAKRG